LLVHIFQGEINKAGFGVGVHSAEAINDGYAQIDSILNPANAQGYSKVKVSVIDNRVPIPKKGYSTFFPDSWNRQRIIEEMSLSFTNKVHIANER
jgi:hypothetical protein